MLIKYHRDSKGNPLGCVVARKDEQGDIHIGFSLCNKKDTFCKEKGRSIAIARSYHMGANTTVPDTLVPTVNHMIERAHKYFNKAVIL